MRASLAIVVDSPPGMTRPSQASSSRGRRTASGLDAEVGEHPQVLADVALQGEDSDGGAAHVESLEISPAG